MNNARHIQAVGEESPTIIIVRLSEQVGFPCGSAVRKSTSNVRDLGSIPGLGRSPGEGKGKPLTECGPLEKGKANYVSILALRTP